MACHMVECDPVYAVETKRPSIIIAPFVRRRRALEP